MGTELLVGEDVGKEGGVGIEDKGWRTIASCAVPCADVSARPAWS